MFSIKELKNLEKHDKYAPENYIPDPGLWENSESNKFEWDASIEKAFHMWIARYQEHMLILDENVLEEKKKEKKTLLALSEAWQKFIDHVEKGKAPTKKDWNTFLELWNRTYRIKKELLSSITTKQEFIGTVDESLLLGMLVELYYLRGRLENTLEPWQEVAIFLDDLGIHLGMAAQLIDSGIFNKKVRQTSQTLLKFAENRFDLRNEIIDAKKIVSKAKIRKAIELTLHNQEFFKMQAKMKVAFKAGPLLGEHSIIESEFELSRLEELLKE